MIFIGIGDIKLQIIENNKIKEKLYVEKLSNGLTVIILPKKTRKKYIVWSTNFGSIDNKFYAPGEDKLTIMPDGIAHYIQLMIIQLIYLSVQIILMRL